MIRAGDSLVNPVTGERLLFELTSHDTDGEHTRFETIVELGREKVVLGEGASVQIDAGTAHRFWNAGDDVLRFTAEVRPSLAFESLIETMFGLAADGKTNRESMPNPLRLAVIARHHFDVARLPVVPDALQRAALVPGALLGRAVGYGPTHETGDGLPSMA